MQSCGLECLEISAVVLSKGTTSFSCLIYICSYCYNAFEDLFLWSVLVFIVLYGSVSLI